MAKRQFLMLAHEYRAAKHGPGGWYMSEKLDGQRCFWDGGITRGIPKSNVPWANMDKDDRYKFVQVSTGLWSRYGNIIHAPNWWLDRLPKIPLDGELYIDRKSRQKLRSIVSKHRPGVGWTTVKFYAFGMVPLESIFADGEINTMHFKKMFTDISCSSFREDLDYYPKQETVFADTYALLRKYCDGNIVIAHEQKQLPFQTTNAKTMISTTLEQVANFGGEGLILRNPVNRWKPERTHDLLKVKKLSDAEGRVIGYTTGRETDKGSRLLGMMGALIIEYDSKRLELSGFSDNERRLREKSSYEEAESWAKNHPGEDCPEEITNPYFPRGSIVSFLYRGLSDDGIPQEARFWRVRKEF